MCAAICDVLFSLFTFQHVFYLYLYFVIKVCDMNSLDNIKDWMRSQCGDYKLHFR